MSEHDEWGPWVEHDGRECPEWLAGVTIEIEAELHTGKIKREIGSFAPQHWAYQKHWDWSFFGKPSGFGWAWARVLRYRVRKPRALRQLRELIENLPAPARTPEHVE